MKKILCIALFAILVTLSAAGAQAAVWYVDGDVSSSGTGTSWAQAFKTIGEAITNGTTVAGDEIWVKEGTYALSTFILVNKAVHIYGGFVGIESQRDERDWAGNVTTVDGSSRCFYVSEDATIDGFTITDGSYDNGGGMSISNSSSPIITNCVFISNTATGGSGSGGAIYISNASPTITNCTFADNQAEHGGAVANVGSSNTIITNCTFSGNTGGNTGGAVRNSGTASLTITNCILWNNSAPNGPQIYNSSTSTPVLSYCDIDQAGYEGSDGNIRVIPDFVDVSDPDPANWDLHLKTTSPCIDVGDNTAPDIPSTDFEDDPRVLDGNADGTPTVDMGADEIDTYYCVTTAAELQAALETAETNGSHDVILVVQGLYFGNFEYVSNEGRSITLEGGYTSGCAARVLDPANTVLDGGNLNAVLNLSASPSGDIAIDGVTIQHGGTGDIIGGGVYVRTNSPSGTAGDISITNCIFSGNSTQKAGESGGGVSISSSTTSGTAGNITIADNIITGNEADFYGGGAHAYSSSNSSGTAGNITIANNIVTNNTAATFAGGVYARSYSTSGPAGTVTLTNNIIAGNTAEQSHGGGASATSVSDAGAGNTVTLTNNTITGNDAPGPSARGGGVHLYRDDDTINCYNNIIWGNTATNGGGDIYLIGSSGTANGYNNDYTSMFGSWSSSGGPNIDADPLFVDAGGGDYHLQTGSPCIDVGENSAPAIPSTDFEGDPRIADGDHNATPTVDMGADEVPTIWYVDGGISPSGDGTSWGTAKKTISEAITVSSDGDEIWVKQGTYVLTSTITVNKSVGLYGGFAGTETSRSQRDWETNTTTVDGDNSNNCFWVSRDVVIDGFTITQGNYSNGGGMYIAGGLSPLIVNCTFTGNNATSGGGGAIYMNTASPTIENCTFSNNTASSTGGAIYTYYGGSPTISNCTFSSTNSAPYGGAIGTINADITISDCTFSGNTATSGGGAVYNGSSTTGTITGCTFTGNDAGGNVGGGIANAGASSLTISDCTFQGNSAHGGAGIHNNSCSPTITRCTFISNTADYSSSSSAGGIRNDYSTPSITNCLFYDNSASYLAGGIFNYSSADATITNCTFYSNSAGTYGGAVANTTSDPTFTNCILWGDTAGTGGDEIYVLSGSPTFTYCDIEGGYTGTGNIDINPLFEDVSDPDPLIWDLHLRSNSACIDAGDNAAPDIPSTDFEGDARIINATVDMGADEAQILSASGSSAALCPDGLGFGSVEEGSSRNLNLIMNNTTDSDINVSAVSTPSSPFTRTADNCGGVTLHPGDTCSITIQFVPSSTGTFYDSFDITTDDPEAGTITVALSGIGTPESKFETRGSSVSGPGAIPDVSATGTGEITSASPPVVEGPASSGNTAPVQTPAPSSSAGTTSGSSSQLMISSLPPDMIREPEKQLLLEEELEPFDSMVFGEVKVGASDQLRITFSHEQGAAIRMGDIVFPSAPYLITEDKCSGTLLDSGGECAVTVQFAPPAAQNFYGYFLIPTDDPEVGALRINLEGTGVSE